MFVFKSVLLIAIGSIIVTAVSLLSFMRAVSKFIGYRVHEQVRDIIPSLIASGIMGIGVVAMSYISLNKLVLLFCQIVFGAVLYMLMSVVFNKQCISMCMKILKRR